MKQWMLFAAFGLGIVAGATGCSTASQPIRVLYVAQGGRFTSAAVPAPDGGAWITLANPLAFGTPRSSGALVHVSRDGKGTLYPLPTLDSYPADPAVAPDGTLWFIYSQGDGMQPTVDTGPALRHEVDYLGRRQPDGAITRISIRPPGDDQFDITGLAVGPDGSVWFTAYQGHYVYGRVWPDGRTAVYQPPAGVIYLSGLLLSADGTVWLIDTRTCDVIRIDPDSGAVPSVTPMPGRQFEYSCAPELARGQDGNIMAITPDGRIAVLDATGKVTAVHGLGAGITDHVYIPSMAADQTGNLWVLASIANARGTPVMLLLRVAPDGLVTRFPVSPAEIYPLHVRIGADGSVWLSDTDVVARFSG